MYRNLNINLCRSDTDLRRCAYAKFSSAHPRCGFALPFVASLRSISIMVSVCVIAGVSRDVCRHRCLAVTAYDCRRAPERPPHAHGGGRADAAATVLRVERRLQCLRTRRSRACVRACVNLYRSAPARRDKR
jgi:hypothetical protein